MGYRVDVALHHERDLTKAAALQEKRVNWNRQRAITTLALPSDASLDDDQRRQLEMLAVSIRALGNILFEERNAKCEQHYQEALGICQRIHDKVGDAAAEFHLCYAYMLIPAIRNLDAAEQAGQRSLDLCDPDDALGRAQCLRQIGLIHHEHLKDAARRKEPVKVLLRHAEAAEKRYLRALQLCAKDAVTELAPLHSSLGNLYVDVGQLDNARKHYELDAQYEEKVGNPFGAGQTRGNIALMYVRASRMENQLSQRRTSLLCARAYAEAALRDFQHYQGRAATDEAKTRSLLDDINQALTELSE